MVILSNTAKGILTVLGAALQQFTYGHFYTAGNMGPYILSYMTRNNKNLNGGDSIWFASIALSAHGFAILTGALLEKKIGFRPTIILSSCVFSGGTLLTYFTINNGFVSVIITDGVMIGLGMGLGYAITMTCAIEWFPAQRGLVIGCIMAGFGMGSLAFTPIQTMLINLDNKKVNNETKLFDDIDLQNRVPNTLLILGGILFSMQLIAFFLMQKKPKVAPKPVSVTEDLPLATDTTPEIKKEVKNLVLKEVVQTIEFYMLWFILLCDIIPIGMFSGLYKVYGQSLISDDRFLTIIATLSAICNSSGRIMWGTFTDKTSFKLPMCLMHLLWGILMLTFPLIKYISNDSLLRFMYSIYVLLIFLVLCGTFSIMPAAASAKFGRANMATNYGIICTAFIVAGLSSALANKYIFPKNAYEAQMITAGIINFIAFCVALFFDDENAPAYFYWIRYRPNLLCAKKDEIQNIQEHRNSLNNYKCSKPFSFCIY